MTQPYSTVSKDNEVYQPKIPRILSGKPLEAFKLLGLVSTSALSIRILSSKGALGRSYSSRVYFRKLHHALCMRRSASIDRSALWLTFPPRYTNSFVWFYTWPAASTLNVAVDPGIPFARKYMISVLASDTVRPNAANTTTISSIIFLSCSGDCETTPASSA